MKKKFTEIGFFPGQAVESYRKSHGGRLPGELPPEEKRCPLCEGTGDRQSLKSLEGERKSIVSKTLKAKGLTVREIQKVMGLSSTSLVQYYLKK